MYLTYLLKQKSRDMENQFKLKLDMLSSIEAKTIIDGILRSYTKAIKQQKLRLWERDNSYNYGYSNNKLNQLEEQYDELKEFVTKSFSKGNELTVKTQINLGTEK